MAVSVRSSNERAVQAVQGPGLQGSGSAHNRARALHSAGSMAPRGGRPSRCPHCRREASRGLANSRFGLLRSRWMMGGLRLCRKSMPVAASMACGHARASGQGQRAAGIGRRQAVCLAGHNSHPRLKPACPLPAGCLKQYPPCRGAASRSAARHVQGWRQRSAVHQTGCGQKGAAWSEGQRHHRAVSVGRRQCWQPYAGRHMPAEVPVVCVASSSAVGQTLKNTKQQLPAHQPNAGRTVPPHLPREQYSVTMQAGRSHRPMRERTLGWRMRDMTRVCGTTADEAKKVAGHWATRRTACRADLACPAPAEETEAGRGAPALSRWRRCSPGQAQAAAHLLLQRAHDGGRQRQALHVVCQVVAVHQHLDRHRGLCQEASGGPHGGLGARFAACAWRCCSKRGVPSPHPMRRPALLHEAGAGCQGCTIPRFPALL